MTFFYKCIICNTKILRFSKRKLKNDLLYSFTNNNDKYCLDLILQNNDLEIIDIHKCKRCKQKTIKIVNKSTGVKEQLWWEYFANLKLIEKEVDDIKNKIHNLGNNEKHNLAVKKKTQLLLQECEIQKLKKENLKYTMMASISIKLQTAI